MILSQQVKYNFLMFADADFVGSDTLAKHGETVQEPFRCGRLVWTALVLPEVTSF